MERQSTHFMVYPEDYEESPSWSKDDRQPIKSMMDLEDQRVFQSEFKDDMIKWFRSYYLDRQAYGKERSQKRCRYLASQPTQDPLNLFSLHIIRMASQSLSGGINRLREEIYTDSELGKIVVSKAVRDLETHRFMRHWKCPLDDESNNAEPCGGYTYCWPSDLDGSRATCRVNEWGSLVNHPKNCEICTKLASIMWLDEEKPMRFDNIPEQTQLKIFIAACGQGIESKLDYDTLSVHHPNIEVEVDWDEVKNSRNNSRHVHDRPNKVFQ